MGIAIGVGGLLLVAAAAVLRWKARVPVVASLAGCAGWALAAQFLLKPLVPGPVLAVVLLSGITLAILVTAVGRTAGAHSSGKLADGTSPSTNARNVGARASSDSSSTSNHVTDGSEDRR